MRQEAQGLLAFLLCMTETRDSLMQQPDTGWQRMVVADVYSFAGRGRLRGSCKLKVEQFAVYVL